MRNARCEILNERVSIPFSYGGILAGKQFCNRIKEMDDLVLADLSGEKLFIHGERRIGKTSLLRKVMVEFSNKKVIPVLINVWKCVDAADTLSLIVFWAYGAGRISLCNR